MERYTQNLVEKKPEVYMVISNLPTAEKLSSTTNDTCSKCSLKATHISNFMGKEKYLCSTHAAAARKKNSLLPSDLWFCMTLEEAKEFDIKHKNTLVENAKN